MGKPSLLLYIPANIEDHDRDMLMFTGWAPLRDHREWGRLRMTAARRL